MKVLDQIEALHTLKEPGWDSYDGEPVSAVATVYARAFMAAVGNVIGSAGDPVAGPRPDGGVSLLWRGRHKVQVIISPVQPSLAEYVVSEKNLIVAKGRVHDVEVFAREILKRVVA